MFRGDMVLQAYKRRVQDDDKSSLPESSRKFLQVLIGSTMVLKLAVATVALAASASAALTKRVTCPDGNVTSNEAVSRYFIPLDSSAPSS